MPQNPSLKPGHRGSYAPETKHGAYGQSARVLKLGDAYWAPAACQWIEGEPKQRMFCGEPVKGGSSYCETHHARCWTKPPDDDASKNNLTPPIESSVSSHMTPKPKPAAAVKSAPKPPVRQPQKDGLRKVISGIKFIGG